MALEVMVPNPAIRNLMREDKIHQIYSQMQVGQDKFGMQTMNQALADLYQRRMVSQEHALSRSPDIEELRKLMGQPQATPGSQGLKRAGGAG
jgi:twitching motility protein PilT